MSLGDAEEPHKNDFLCLLRRSDLLRVYFSEETCGTAHALNLTNTICCANLIKTTPSYLNPLLEFFASTEKHFFGPLRAEDWRPEAVQGPCTTAIGLCSDCWI